MTEERPYPLDQPEITFDVQQILADNQAHFDGATWLLMTEMLYPYEEVFFIAALDPETVRLTRNTMSIGLALAETPHGFVLRASITFVDYPVNPSVVETFLNPAVTAARRWLEMLSEQEFINVLQMDKDSGEKIKMTRMEFALQLRETARQVLAATPESAKPNPEQWLAAVDYYHRHTAPAPGHVRLHPSGAEYNAGRNEPCPCGSGKKFKHCHGA